MHAFLLSLALLQVNGVATSQIAERDQFEAVLSTKPGDVAAQEGEVGVSEKIALAERAAGDSNAALSDLLRAKKFAPRSPRLLYDTGALEEQLGLLHDADETVERLRQLSPNGSQMHYLAAHIELDLGRLADAEKDMRAYLALHSEDATAHYGLGRILQQAQQGPEARIEFERCIALMPLQTESYYQLGQLAMDAGDYEAAIREDGKVLARDPTHGGAAVGMGIALFRLKRFPEAEAQLKRATELAPEYQLGHYYYGLVLARVGKKENSTRELALAAKMAEETNRKEAQRLRLGTQ